MMLATMGWLVLIYAVPVVLAALWFSGNPARRPWQVIVVLVLLPLFLILHFMLLERLQGWPIHAPVPEAFQLLSHRVTEPDPRTGDPGEIIVWLQAEGSQRLRAHALPYDAALHRRLNEAATRLAEGRPQRGEYRTEEREAPTGAAGDAEPGQGILVFRDDDRRLPPKPATP
jgi:hypothetical protein